MHKAAVESSHQPGGNVSHGIPSNLCASALINTFSNNLNGTVRKEN